VHGPRPAPHRGLQPASCGKGVWSLETMGGVDLPQDHPLCVCTNKGGGEPL